MDAFEQLAADILWTEGYWVRTNVKVALSAEDKQAISRPSSPRWEVDLVAYNAQNNELLVLECKSYLDSGGVHVAHFDPGNRLAGRYKLFNSDTLRERILGCLKVQLIDRGLCPSDVTLRFGLVYGYATAFNAAKLEALFAERGWLLYGPDWLVEHLTSIAGAGYENSTAAVVAKLLQTRRQAA